MSEPISIIFQFGDGGTHDASTSETSASQPVCYQHGWLLTPIGLTLDANPTYTLEVSNDGTNWQAYDSRITNAAINQPFDDTHMNGLFFRIVYNAQTNTTGTVEFQIVMKQG